MLNVYDLLCEMMYLYEKVNLCDLMFDEMMFTKDILRKGFLNNLTKSVDLCYEVLCSKNRAFRPSKERVSNGLGREGC